MHLPNFGNSTTPQLASSQWSLFCLWQLENEEMEVFCKHHCAMAIANKKVFAQFTKAQSIHLGFKGTDQRDGSSPN
jgi:hypothetical protein